MTQTTQGAGDAWGDKMRAALGGDDAAYRHLLADMAQAFRGEARRRMVRAGRGNGDIEDIVQEALLAIHLKRSTWDTSRPLAAWAFAILTYKVTDRLRRDRMRQHEPIDETFDLAAPEAADTGLRADLTRVLGRLTEGQRGLVLAISVEGRSAAEVARQTGSSEGAVRVALHRALKRMALIFREERQ